MIKYLDVIALSQLAIFLIFLVSRGKGGLLHRFLIVLMIVLIFGISDRILYHFSSQDLGFWFHFIFISDTLQFLFLPVLFLYVKAVANNQKSFRKVDAIHFIPFLLIFLNVFLTFSIQSIEAKRDIALSIPVPSFYYRGRLDYIFTDLVSNLQILYIPAALFVLRKEGKSKKRKSTNVYWLKFTLVAFLILKLSAIFYFMLPDEYKLESVPFIDIMLIAITGIIIFFGYKQSDLSPFGMEIRNDALANELRQKREFINLFMETEKPYLDSELMLSKLAGQLKMNEKQLSQVLNSVYEQNFFDFINSYRVEHAKTLMRAQGNGNILDIMADSGFSSKSAFNRAFKKHAGCTPTEYRSTQLSSVK